MWANTACQQPNSSKHRPVSFISSGRHARCCEARTAVGCLARSCRLHRLHHYLHSALRMKSALQRPWPNPETMQPVDIFNTTSGITSTPTAAADTKGDQSSKDTTSSIDTVTVALVRLTMDIPAYSIVYMADLRPPRVTAKAALAMLSAHLGQRPVHIANRGRKAERTSSCSLHTSGLSREAQCRSRVISRETRQPGQTWHNLVTLLDAAGYRQAPCFETTVAVYLTMTMPDRWKPTLGSSIRHRRPATD